ncbi:CinA family protein [Ketogulonicigenium vulgare]|uniref:CinA family protein n=1 Tax=Ketogulonicigenium vulgare TaxID=92945 RepID=UPI0023585A28|nr:CinA family protein [Ketogulonicigenium vulgare]
MTRAAEILLEQAKAAGAMIATAESCTGGMVAAAITDIAGSSAIFDRGFVTYTNDAKVAMLGVQGGTLDRYGAVSEQVAGQMARGAIHHSTANFAVATTGIAGPGGSEFKPEGRVCFAVAGPGFCHTETVEFGAIGRADVRARATAHALSLLLREVK